MQKVLTAEEMREVDRLTTEKYGIPSILLMENAAHAVARVIAEKLGGSVEGKSILVLCGTGNNGGDGAALARILWTQKATVTVAIIGKIDDAQGDARTNFDILIRLNEREAVRFNLNSFEVLEYQDVYTRECSTLQAWKEFLDEPFNQTDPDILVDALFGTGLSRPLTDLYEEVASYVRGFKVDGVEQDTYVVSLDIPSGLNTNMSDKIGVNAHAHLTVTFTAPKPANVLPPASNFNGELVVANIGSPQELIVDSPSQLYLAKKSDATRWLERTKFSSDSYKNNRGHAFLIAGSKEYSGAAVLCGNAAMRSGVGLVTIMTPESAIDAVAPRVLPEVIVISVAEIENGAVAENAFPVIEELWIKADAVAIGSGLSSDQESTRKLVRKVVENRRTPVVIDADGLNALAPFDLNGSDELPLILTPHDGEFLRLLGTTDKDILIDRVKAVREFAQKHDVILVLKGERVLIADASGKVVVNPTGNSGLGKAGNGDTLTGIIAGFVAQAAAMNVGIFETVVAAVFIAGSAGDIAEEKFGKRVMTASDVRECLAEAFERNC